ncbi:MAG: 3-oxoacyl-ACP reductase FabG, partial [Deltaproteobacteria bacterium]|nr:3-oxoacyl-ACP reductase FabG [Deltaproteobacteria bacterium]
GKVAVVTGGSRGFGKAMALGLADAGAEVVVASRTQADLDKVAEEIKAKGQKALAIATDTTDMDSIKNLAAKTIEEFGKIDILVNNAGQGTSIPFLSITEEQWDYIINVNLKGYFLCTQVLGGYMFKAKSGRIINISSTMGSYPLPFLTHYAASKGGINAMTKCLAQEWANRGITVNAIAPSYFETDLNKDSMANEDISQLIMSKTPLKRWGKVEDLVGLVVFLASDASSYMTGSVIPLDGGWSAG